MKKIIALFLLASIFVGVLSSCGGNAGNNVQKPYGVEDRFIGCWIEEVEAPEADSAPEVSVGDEYDVVAASKERYPAVVLFLPNGEHHCTFPDGEYRDDYSGTWYTTENQVLAISNFATYDVLKYEFVNRDRVVISFVDRWGEENKVVFNRTDEHYAQFAYVEYLID